jgi:hypothetical protein
MRSPTLAVKVCGQNPVDKPEFNLTECVTGPEDGSMATFGKRDDGAGM